MTKFQYTGGQAGEYPRDYPTLGFRVLSANAILNGALSDPVLTVPPDVRWTVYGGGSAETGILRYTAIPGYSAPVPEPSDGYILAYSDDDNAVVYTSPADFVAIGPVAAAIEDAAGAASPVQSVAGEVGAVSAADLATALEGDLSGTYASRVSLDAVRDHPLAPFWRKLGTDPENVVIVRSGDSTTQGDNNYFSNALKFLTTNGCALAGMDPANIIKHGNTGFPLGDYLDYENGVGGAPVPAHPWSETVAADPDLIIDGWLTNDAVLIGVDLPTAIDLLEQLIALRDRDVPGVPLVFVIPAPYTTDVVVTDFFDGGVNTPEEATAIVRAAHMDIRDRFDHVLVVDTAELYGTAVLPSSPLMQDQLHPQNWAHYWNGFLVGREIAPPGKEYPAMGPERRYVRNGQVTYSATGLVQIQALDWPGGFTPYLRSQKATTWMLDATSDLYCDGGIVDLATGVTTSAPSTHILQISKSGVAFDTLAPEGTIVQLVGDFVDDGFHTGLGIDYIDPPALVAGASAAVDMTVTGIKKAQRHKLIPSTGLPTTYTLSSFAVADDVVRITFSNFTGGSIDYGTDEWRCKF